MAMSEADKKAALDWRPDTDTPCPASLHAAGYHIGCMLAASASGYAEGGDWFPRCRADGFVRIAFAAWADGRRGVIAWCGGEVPPIDEVERAWWGADPNRNQRGY